MAKAVEKLITSLAPDAELIALGRELDRLVERYDASAAAWRGVSDEHSRRVAAWQAEHPAHTEQELGTAYTALLDGLQAKVGLPHPDNILDARSTKLSRSIMAMPATTIAGLSVKAKLAAFAEPNLWDESDSDADWGDLCVRKLIDDVLKAAKFS